MKRNRFAAGLMLVSMGFSACQDLPTSGSPMAVQQPNSAGYEKMRTAQPMFVCFTSERQRTGPYPYHYTAVALHFLANEVATGARTRQFRLRVRFDGHAPVLAANCRIPDTKAAAERVYKAMVRMLGRKARLDPLREGGLMDEPRYLVETRRSGARWDGTPVPTYDLPPLVATGTPSDYGGATGWTGDGWTPSDWNSLGSTPSDGSGGGYGTSSEPAAATDGPLGYAACVGVVGLIALAGLGYEYVPIYRDEEELHRVEDYIGDMRNGLVPWDDGKLTRRTQLLDELKFLTGKFAVASAAVEVGALQSIEACSVAWLAPV